MRSFRFQLAARVAAAMGLALLSIAVLSYVGMRASLDRQINATLMNIASIQAASVTSAPSGEMVFHEWALTPDEAASVLDLNRYAQVWTAGGRSLLRTRYLTRDLPLNRTALARAGQGHLVWSEDRLGAVPIRSLYYPLVRLGPAHAHHVLEVAAPLVARNATLHNLAELLLALVLAGTAGSFATSWWLAARVIRPVHDIIDQSEAIGAHTLGRRIEAYADTQEYERLVQVLNTMLQRLDEAFEAQRRFTADASHELRSPLTALQGELGVALRRERTPEEYRRVIRSALEEGQRLARTADDLLTLARADGGGLRPRLREEDLAAAAQHTCERLRAKARAAHLRLSFRDGRAPAVLIDPELVERMAYNLVENAIKYTPAGGAIAVEVAQHEQGAVLRVQDTGPGIPGDQLDRIFDRFVRLDEARTPEEHAGGTGLGLSIARAIARAHGAILTAANRPSRGSVFTAYFPAIIGITAGAESDVGEDASPEPAGVDADALFRFRA